MVDLIPSLPCPLYVPSYTGLGNKTPGVDHAKIAKLDREVSFAHRYRHQQVLA